jgi:GR25 family glycosyltransferase involved in LPS biosynthesis
LLGHRKIWRLIAKRSANPKQHFLILESDSKIENINDFNSAFADNLISNKGTHYDLFFWGAWNGNTRIKKSTASTILNKFTIGAPLIKSVYGTYGYSITPNGAKILLKQTAKISYPVDYFKHHLINADIQIGAIRPAMIDTWKTTPSNIVVENNWVNIKRWIIIRVFDFRNMIIAYFC